MPGTALLMGIVGALIVVAVAGAQMTDQDSKPPDLAKPPLTPPPGAAECIQPPPSGWVYVPGEEGDTSCALAPIAPCPITRINGREIPCFLLDAELVTAHGVDRSWWQYTLGDSAISFVIYEDGSVIDVTEWSVKPEDEDEFADAREAIFGDAGPTTGPIDPPTAH
jgi:hypothetical protein